MECGDGSVVTDTGLGVVKCWIHSCAGFSRWRWRSPRLAFIDAAAVRADEAPPAVIDEAPPPAPPRALAPAPVLSRSVKLGLNNSLVVDLPRDARDILVSNPAIADAVIRTSRRIYLTGIAVGQANIIVFDRAGRQIVTLDLEVERDNSTARNDASAAHSRLRHQRRGGQRQHRALRHRPERRRFAQGPGHRQHLRQWRRQRPAAERRQQRRRAPAAATRVAASPSPPAGTTPTSSVVNLLTIEGRGPGPPQGHHRRGRTQLAKQLGVDWNRRTSTSAAFSSARPRSRNGLPVNGPLGTSLAGADINDYVTPKIGDDAGKRINAQHLFGATLQALERNGLFRTLAEPTLTAISGETASFLAGGEFPVPVRPRHRGQHHHHLQALRRQPELHPGRALGGPHQPARQDRGLRALAGRRHRARRASRFRA